MELKQVYKRILDKEEGLLIVPYGIETIRTETDISNLAKLLIVPYGIETYHRIAKIILFLFF